MEQIWFYGTLIGPGATDAHIGRRWTRLHDWRHGSVEAVHKGWFVSKRKRQRRPGTSINRPVPAPAAQQPSSPWLRRIPLWGWALIFVLPLILSEFMFSVVGRTGDMVLFPIAWIGFWAAILYRYWWPVLKRWLRFRE